MISYLTFSWVIYILLGKTEWDEKELKAEEFIGRIAESLVISATLIAGFLIAQTRLELSNLPILFGIAIGIVLAGLLSGTAWTHIKTLRGVITGIDYPYYKKTWMGIIVFFVILIFFTSMNVL